MFLVCQKELAAKNRLIPAFHQEIFYFSADITVFSQTDT